MKKTVFLLLMLALATTAFAQEKVIVFHAGSLSVLVINPRKDMYIMCD